MVLRNCLRFQTLNPVPVYECAVRNGSATKYIAGALAYEGAWRCVHFDPSSPSCADGACVSSKGPGAYQVYTDSFGHAKGVQATPATPFPSGAIVPLFAGDLFCFVSCTD